MSSLNAPELCNDAKTFDRCRRVHLAHLGLGISLFVLSLVWLLCHDATEPQLIFIPVALCVVSSVPITCGLIGWWLTRHERRRPVWLVMYVGALIASVIFMLLMGRPIATADDGVYFVVIDEKFWYSEFYYQCAGLYTVWQLPLIILGLKCATLQWDQGKAVPAIAFATGVELTLASLLIGFVLQLLLPQFLWPIPPGTISCNLLVGVFLILSGIIRFAIWSRNRVSELVEGIRFACLSRNKASEFDD